MPQVRQPQRENLKQFPGMAAAGWPCDLILMIFMRGEK
ncbi:hypothetical protein CPter91_1877 [Collimonas pratensis]|uniref:Uncharacterized protein n=1 Tax=Collimonas pratensis TaxID=279113 RepID=A0A127Q2E2_9BURK|nr:hypothetical protein CPter91_1877 [Collimonas pratensis]